MLDQKKLEVPVYVAPKLTVIGSLAEVTLQSKIGLQTDGVFLFNKIVNASP
jgi:hypothetical protein